MLIGFSRRWIKAPKGDELLRNGPRFVRNLLCTVVTVFIGLSGRLHSCLSAECFCRRVFLCIPLILHFFRGMQQPMK